MKHIVIFTCLLLGALVGYSQSLKTPTLSPFSKISQEIGLTEVILTYSRPSAKGRTVFGALVPYGKVWRTGANGSTKIMFTESVHIGGKALQPGTYAIYTIPGKEMWTIIISSNTKLRSLAGDAYNQTDDVFRFDVKSQTITNYVETFTLQFAALGTDSFHLQLAWENTMITIPIKLEVDQKIEQQMEELMKNPGSIPHRTYFEAAQYYINNDKNLSEALTFINVALEKSSENFRYGLLKSKIQHKGGDSKAALITINEAYTWAKNAKNDNYIEQTDLFRHSLLIKE